MNNSPRHKLSLFGYKLNMTSPHIKNWRVAMHNARREELEKNAFIANVVREAFGVRRVQSNRRYKHER